MKIHHSLTALLLAMPCSNMLGMQPKKLTQEEMRKKAADAAEKRANAQKNNNPKTSQENTQENICAICQEKSSTTENPLLQTTCAHLFHQDCLNGWRRHLAQNYQRPTCPMCRINDPLFPGETAESVQEMLNREQIALREEEYAISELNNINITNINGRQTLTITGYGITSLSGISNIPNINTVEVVNINLNQIGIIPANTFSALENLQELNILGNRAPLLIQQNAFNNLPRLQKINIENESSFLDEATPLPSIIVLASEAFNNLPNLETITLQGDPLVNIPQNALRNLPKLKSLNLSQSRIQHIEAGAFNNLPALEELNLKGNNLQIRPTNQEMGLSESVRIDW